MFGAAMARSASSSDLAVAGACPPCARVPLLAGMGFAMSSTMATANTIVQTTAPDALRGRVMSVYMTVFAGTLPLGALIVGAVADAFGTPASLALGGTTVFLAALALAGWSVRPARRAPAAGLAPAGAPASHPRPADLMGFGPFVLLSLFYAIIGVRVIGQLVARRRETFDRRFTLADRALVDQAAFFVLVPISVALHELGHAVAIWLQGGTVEGWGYYLFAGYVSFDAAPFDRAQRVLVAVAGTVVNVLLAAGAVGLVFLRRPPMAPPTTNCCSSSQSSPSATP